MPRAQTTERRRKTSGAESVAQGICAHPDCTEAAHYRAPKSAGHVNDDNPQGRYVYFCLDHVREYNRSWDFFADMSAAEIEAFQRESITGHRKTKPVGLKASGKYRHFTEYLHPNDAWIFDFLGHTGRATPEPPKPKASKKERWAMAVFDLDAPFSQQEVKTRYRKLAHQYHPDKHGGDRKAEAKFKEITEAYSVLKNIAGALAFA